MIVLLVVVAVLVAIASIRSARGDAQDATRDHGGAEAPEDERHDDEDNGG